MVDREEQLENFIREILNVYCIGTCECHEDNVDCKYKNPAGFGCFIWSKAEELGIEVDR